MKNILIQQEVDGALYENFPEDIKENVMKTKMKKASLHGTLSCRQCALVYSISLNS